ncbi:hypothetical protein R6Q57_023150 [Mikania cordata]
MVRQQFRKHMHETDPEKIQKLKDETTVCRRATAISFTAANYNPPLIVLRSSVAPPAELWSVVVPSFLSIGGAALRS